jgi:hypothetical protein
LIIAGIVLANNGQWFHGAHTVGVVCLVVGIVGVIIQLAIFAGAIFGGTRR